MNVLIKSVAAMLLAGAAGIANANLLTNGDFEANVGLTGSSWGVYSSIPGWTTLNGSGIEVERNTVVTAQSGSQYVELDSYNNSAMYQQISGLTVGASYDLSLWYHARTNNGSNDNGINVYWGDFLPGNETINIEGLTLSNTPDWIQLTKTLVATSSSMYLTFGADGLNNSLGGFVDNVSLTAVPEPATLSLFGLGLAGLLLARRKQKQA